MFYDHRKNRTKPIALQTADAVDEFDELDALSAFYAENNDDDNDPEYQPNGINAASAIGAANKNSSAASSRSLNCQLCSSSVRRFASLKRHYITMHGYEQSLATVRIFKSLLLYYNSPKFVCTGDLR